MKQRLMKSFLGSVFFLMAMVSSLTYGNDGYAYQCTHLNKVRMIEVVYLQRESSLPCEVNYIKDGVEKTLWNARYTEGYCEDKASEFSQLQESWGWRCEKMEMAASVQ